MVRSELLHALEWQKPGENFIQDLKMDSLLSGMEETQLRHKKL